MKRVSLNQQIEEIDRELAVRGRLTRWGSMTESQCAFCTQRLDAAGRSLRWLKANERLIRARCPELFARARGC